VSASSPEEIGPGMDVPPGTEMPEGFELGDGIRRLSNCVEAWPACSSSEYNPACCRFPKSCSANSVANRVYRAGSLEPGTQMSPDQDRAEAKPSTMPDEIETARRNLAAELKQMLRRNDLAEYSIDVDLMRDLLEVLDALAPASSLAEHLTPTTSSRGFDRYPAIPGAYGGQAEVYESSAASSPHVWLATTDPRLHLTAENAGKLAEQLLALVANHYQSRQGRQVAASTGWKCGTCEATDFACTACGARVED